MTAAKNQTEICLKIFESRRMEEYIPFIKQFAYGEQKYNFTVAQKNFSVSYLPASEAEVVCIEIAEDVPYTISGNNIDGYIITEWR